MAYTFLDTYTGLWFSILAN